MVLTLDISDYVALRSFDSDQDILQVHWDFFLRKIRPDFTYAQVQSLLNGPLDYRVSSSASLDFCSSDPCRLPEFVSLCLPKNARPQSCSSFYRFLTQILARVTFFDLP